MKVRLKFSKRTRFLSHMLASVAFIGLFIWGWDLSPKDAAAYLIISIGCVVALASVAAILGFLLRLFRSRFDPIEED